VCLASELTAVAAAGVFQWRDAIDEEHGVIDVVLLTTVAEGAV
jgi:hypothetical protein